MLPDMRRDTVKLGNLLSIAEQIQTFGLGRKTGEIYITNVPPPARINLIDGEIVDAQFGLRSGLEAAMALINLTDRQTELIKLAPTNPYLRITMGTEIKTFPIRPGLAYIGRSTVNDIVINDSTISQRHASIEYSRNGVFLKDLSW